MAGLNFISRKSKARSAATLVAILTVSTAVAGALLEHRHLSLHATIGDTVNESPPFGSDQPTAKSVPQALTDVPVNSVTRGPVSDTLRYYEAQTGRAFQINLRTRAVSTLSDKKLAGFVRVIWSPDKDQVVGLFSQNDATAYRYYSYGTGQIAPIGSLPQSVIFSPDSQHLALLETGVGAASIRISSPNGNDTRTILNTRITDGALSWPLKGSLALFSRHNDQSSYDLTLVGLNGELAPLLSGLNNLEYAWSPDGSKLLYSYFESGKGIRLWYMDIFRHVQIPLDVPTGARKCAWTEENSIVCGVPHNTLLSRDVSSADSATLDDIVAIDLADGTQHPVYGAKQGTYIGVIDPLVSSSGSSFIFTNLFDQKLYSLEI